MQFCVFWRFSLKSCNQSGRPANGSSENFLSLLFWFWFWIFGNGTSLLDASSWLRSAWRKEALVGGVKVMVMGMNGRRGLEIGGSGLQTVEEDFEETSEDENARTERDDQSSERFEKRENDIWMHSPRMMSSWRMKSWTLMITFASIALVNVFGWHCNDWILRLETWAFVYHVFSTSEVFTVFARSHRGQRKALIIASMQHETVPTTMETATSFEFVSSHCVSLRVLLVLFNTALVWTIALIDRMKVLIAESRWRLASLSSMDLHCRSHSLAMQCTWHDARSYVVFVETRYAVSHEWPCDAGVGISRTCASVAHALTTRLPVPCSVCDDRSVNSGVQVARWRAVFTFGHFTPRVSASIWSTRVEFSRRRRLTLSSALKGADMATPLPSPSGKTAHSRFCNCADHGEDSSALVLMRWLPPQKRSRSNMDGWTRLVANVLHPYLDGSMLPNARLWLTPPLGWRRHAFRHRSVLHRSAPDKQTQRHTKRKETAALTNILRRHTHIAQPYATTHPSIPAIHSCSQVCLSRTYIELTQLHTSDNTARVHRCGFKLMLQDR